MGLPENPGTGAKLADTYTHFTESAQRVPWVFCQSVHRNASVGWKLLEQRFITLQHPDLNVVLAGNYTTSATSVTLPFTQTGTLGTICLPASRAVVDNLSNPVNVTLPEAALNCLPAKKTLTDSEPISMEKPGGGLSQSYKRFYSV